MDASRGWLIASAIGSSLTAAFVAAVGWLHWQATQAAQGRHAELRGLLTEVRDLQRAAAKSTWVASDDLTHNCHANDSGVTCTVTNLHPEAVTTCLRGKLAQKKASGATLNSLVICTGWLGPRDTRTVSAPWVGGFAKDLCNSTDRWGNQVLDWEACNFTTEPAQAPSK